MLGSEELDRRVGDQRILFLQEAVEPVEGVDPEFLGVLVRPFGDLQAELFGLAVEFVDATDLLVDTDDTVERKDAIFVGVGDQQRPWGEQCRDLGVVPAERVDLEHAVAVALDAAVDNVIGQVRDAGHRDGDPDPVIECADPPAVGTTAGPSRDPDPLAIDLLPRLQVIQGPDAVPGFDSGRRITAGIPPPLGVPVGAVVNPFDLTQLQSVDRQAGVAVAGEPAAVVLVVHLAAVADPVLLDLAVAANIEDRRQAALVFFWQVKVAGNIQPGARLKLNFLDREIRVIGPTGDDRFERCPGRPGREPEHFEKLFAILAPPGLPIVQRRDVGKTPLGQPTGFGSEVGIDHAVTGRGVGGGAGVGGQDGDHRGQEDEQKTGGAVHGRMS